MNSKYANVDGWTPTQMLLMSALGGAGGFGAMRLLTDMMHKAQPPEQNPNAVKLMLPDPLKDKNQHQTQQMETMTSASPKLAGAMDNVAMGLVGVPAGFMGAKFLYDKYMQHNLQQKVDASKQQYIDELQKIQQQNAKIGEETPRVDAFCSAIAEEFEKDAGWLDFMKSHDSQLASTPLAKQKINEQYSSALGDSTNHLTGGVPGTFWDATKIVGGLSLAGTLGSLIYANQQKRNKEMKARYPTTVEYA